MNPRLLVACLLLLVPYATVQAQKVYKIIQPDGRVIYSDQPLQGKTTAKELPPVPEQSGIQVASPEEIQAVNERTRARFEEEEKRRQASAEASAKLKEAEKAKVEGVEPLPGERTGIKTKTGGRTRLNEDYDERQKKLDQDLDDARRKAGN